MITMNDSEAVVSDEETEVFHIGQDSGGPPTSVESEMEVYKTWIKNSVFEYPVWLTSFSCGSWTNLRRSFWLGLFLTCQ